MNESLKEQVANVAPSLGFEAQVSQRKRTSKSVTRNQKIINSILELAEGGKNGEKRKVLPNIDVLRFLNFLEQAERKGEISAVDLFFCLIAIENIEALGQNVQTKVNDLLCYAATQITILIKMNSSKLTEDDYEVCHNHINIIKSQSNEFKSFRSLTRDVLTLGIDVDPTIAQTPALEEQDCKLSLLWHNGISSLPTNIHDNLINHIGRDNYDVGRLLSARAAEKAMMCFYKECGYDVTDIAITQLEEDNDLDWKYYDLKVNNKLIDVKNARRSKNNRNTYVEHCIKRAKSTKDGLPVIIAGILSQYLWVKTLLAPEESAIETSLLVLGETSYDIHTALKEIFERKPYFEIDFSRATQNKSFLPAWIFDYPQDFYKRRNVAIAQLSQKMVPDFELCKYSKFNPLPSCIAAGIDLSSQWPDEALSLWERDFYRELFSLVRNHSLLLPFLYLSLLSHFIYMVHESSDEAEYSPAMYRRFVFAVDKITDKPLSIYDPLETINALINTLDILWSASSDRKLIRDFKYFKLCGFNILKGKCDIHDKWKTLVAYCGGWKRNEENHARQKCGEYPLVLGNYRHCEECGRLICRKCDFCSPNCRRKKGDSMKTVDKKQIVGRARKFWHDGDQIICTRIFHKTNNQCYLCGDTPLERAYVLFNSASSSSIDLDSKCLIRLKKIMEYFGAKNRILFFRKNQDEADLFNNKHDGTAEIIKFVPNPQIIEMLMSKPNELEYESVRAILDFTSKFKSGRERELFYEAMELYAERQYYIYEGIKKFEKGDDVKDIIEKYLREDAEQALEDDRYEHSYEYREDLDDDFSMDDLAPEGMGSGEIDWDSHQ